MRRVGEERQQAPQADKQSLNHDSESAMPRLAPGLGSRVFDFSSFAFSTDQNVKKQPKPQPTCQPLMPAVALLCVNFSFFSYAQVFFFFQLSF